MGSFTIRVIDTPGLIDCGMVDLESLQSIVGTLVGRSVDVVLYVDRWDAGADGYHLIRVGRAGAFTWLAWPALGAPPGQAGHVQTI